MATNRWRGDAPAVAQVNTITPASVTVGNVFTLTINGKSLSFTATAATIANVTAGLAAAVAASSIAEFQELDAADNTTNLTLTARTPGVPFTQTSNSATGTGSAGHSLSTSTSVANSGPNCWGIAGNWSLGAIPVDGDDVYLEESAVDILYNLNQSSVDLVSLNVAASYTGRLGLPAVNDSGSYFEYRTRHLTLTADTVNIGYGEGSGSGRVLLSLGANATTILVTKTGSPESQSLPAVGIAGSGSTYTLTVLDGSVGVGIELGQTATLDTVTLSGAAVVTLGVGCTVATVRQAGGTLTLHAAVTTLNVDGAGSTTYVMAGAVGALNIDGGTVWYRSTGPITTLKVGTAATINFTLDVRSRTVTNCTIEAGGAIVDTAKTVTWTNGISLNRCSLAEVALDLGTHFTVLVSSPAVGAAGVYSGLIGDGVATSYTIIAATHGLAGNGRLIVDVYDAATGLREEPAVTVNNATGAVTLVFSSAPASNAKRVVILGASA
jgi:hypothetical protein